MIFPNSWNMFDYFKLSCIKKVSAANKVKIIERYNSFSEFISDKDNPFVQNLELFNSPLDEVAEKQISDMEKSEVYAVSIWSESYPVLLKKIAYPPIMLFVKGDLAPNDADCISIVGTRHCTTYGRLNAEKFAENFVLNGLVVVSGLAYGIDTHAHMGALRGNGKTYAVIASGIDQISPDPAVKNAEKIIKSGGAIISEYPCGVKAFLGSFPQRNRIVAGISMATLVIESGKKGGSLITAALAFDESREVFALPGNIDAAKSEGTNFLIKSNRAQIAINPESILDDLGINNTLVKSESKKFKNSVQEKIYNRIALEPVHIDVIALDCELEITNVLVSVLELEFLGLVRQLPGKFYVKIK